MKVGVPKETASGEQRVALVPEAAGRLADAGIELVVEAGAGVAAAFPDAAFAEAGATVVADAAALYANAELVTKVQRPTPDEIALLRPGQSLVAFLQPLVDADTVRAIADRGATAFSMDAIPRITRAQAMDALSSQATVAGYKAVLLAAERSPRFFPMLITAAGTIPPTKLLVLGAGVAGLQAIATARRLGAVVSAFDTRPVVREQVESLGATFLELEVTGGETAGGYATELSEEQHEREIALIAAHAAQSDAIVTTALIPGRPAPLLITEEAVRSMRPGSVIVDLAVERGGNVEGAKAGEVVTSGNGVTIVGHLNVPGRIAASASLLYAKNLYAFLETMVDKAAKELAINRDDELVKATMLTDGGAVVHQSFAHLKAPAESAAGGE